jgi:hypothetical protein
MTTTTQMQELYIDTNGGVYCTDHIGFEAESFLARHGGATSFSTSLTQWTRATKLDRLAWLEQMGVPMPCFTCHFGH